LPDSQSLPPHDLPAKVTSYYEQLQGQLKACGLCTGAL
jgi:hypothetical protein